MKYFYKFLFKKELTIFDCICVISILYFTLSQSLWFILLLVPSSFLSLLLTTHFEVTEKLDS